MKFDDVLRLYGHPLSDVPSDVSPEATVTWPDTWHVLLRGPFRFEKDIKIRDGWLNQPSVHHRHGWTSIVQIDSRERDYQHSQFSPIATLNVLKVHFCKTTVKLKLS